MDSKGARTLMDFNGPCFKLIYLIDTNYEGQIDSKFTFLNKGVLEITQGYTKVSEQDL